MLLNVLTGRIIFLYCNLIGLRLEVFNSIGHVPLPPYIKRPDEDLDKDRYATVYEDKNLQESVAAPTAGLHFDDELLEDIKKLGVKMATVNLSVGAGTFQPVKVDNIKDHDIHSEYLDVSPEVVDMVNTTKQQVKKFLLLEQRQQELLKQHL